MEDGERHLSLTNAAQSCPKSQNSFWGKFSKNFFFFKKLFNLDRIVHMINRIGQE